MDDTQKFLPEISRKQEKKHQPDPPYKHTSTTPPILSSNSVKKHTTLEIIQQAQNPQFQKTLKSYYRRWYKVC